MPSSFCSSSGFEFISVSSFPCDYKNKWSSKFILPDRLCLDELLVNEQK